MPRDRKIVAASSQPSRKSPRKRKLADESAIEELSTENNPVKAVVLLPADAADTTPIKRVKIAATKSVNGSVTNNHTDTTGSGSQRKSRVGVLPTNPSTILDVKQSEPSKSGESPTKLESKKSSKTAVKKSDDQTITSDTEKAVTAKNGGEKRGKIVRKRKTKEEKEADAMPLAARTNGLKMFVGAHVSIAKGLENAITNSLHIGGNAFALFLKSQRKWDNPALKDENRDAFKHHCTHHQYDQSSHVVPHGSYLVNLASPDKEMSNKSYNAFVDDLRRCETLGIKYYNFHPGSTNKEPLGEAIGRLASNLNRALAETTTVTPLLENMAGHGSIIGSRFTDLRDIIAAIKPQFRSRIGICIDTCHTFAAGYDLRTPAAFAKTFQELDETVGLKYLKAMHINDSKAPFDSHRDLHQNIGTGFLGLRAFHNVMNDARLENVPLILETPCDKPDPNNPKKTIDDKGVWAREIKLLESLIGMDPEGDEFKKLEADLSEVGRAEREKMEQSIQAREDKARRKAERALEKGQKSISAMFGGKNKKRKSSVSSSSDLSDAESDA